MDSEELNVGIRFLLKQDRSQDEGKHAQGKEFQRDAARGKKSYQYSFFVLHLGIARVYG